MGFTDPDYTPSASTDFEKFEPFADYVTGDAPFILLGAAVSDEKIDFKNSYKPTHLVLLQIAHKNKAMWLSLFGSRLKAQIEKDITEDDIPCVAKVGTAEAYPGYAPPKILQYVKAADPSKVPYVLPVPEGFHGVTNTNDMPF